MKRLKQTSKYVLSKKLLVLCNIFIALSLGGIGKASPPKRRKIETAEKTQGNFDCGAGFSGSCPVDFDEDAQNVIDASNVYWKKCLANLGKDSVKDSLLNDLLDFEEETHSAGPGQHRKMKHSPETGDLPTTRMPFEEQIFGRENILSPNVAICRKAEFGFDAVEEICMGTLLNNTHVITTADCVDKKPGDHSTHVYVVRGYQTKGLESIGIEWFVESIYIHPNYIRGTKDNNVAIVSLGVSLTADKNAVLATKRQENADFSFENCHIYTYESAPNPMAPIDDETLRILKPNILGQSYDWKITNSLSKMGLKGPRKPLLLSVCEYQWESKDLGAPLFCNGENFIGFLTTILVEFPGYALFERDFSMEKREGYMEIAQPGVFPSAVVIARYDRENNAHIPICTAALVNSVFATTSARCLEAMKKNSGNLKVIAGASNVAHFLMENEQPQIIDIEKTEVFKLMYSDEGTFEIFGIFLKNALCMSENVQEVKIPPPGHLVSFTECFIVGTLFEKSSLPNMGSMFYHKVKVVNDANEKSLFKSRFPNEITIKDEMWLVDTMDNTLQVYDLGTNLYCNGFFLGSLYTVHPSLSRYLIFHNSVLWDQAQWVQDEIEDMVLSRK